MKGFVMGADAGWVNDAKGLAGSIVGKSFSAGFSTKKSAWSILALGDDLGDGRD